MPPEFTTADLCDDFRPGMQAALPVFRDFGGARAFAGPMATLRVFEDNALVGEELTQPGEGRVLVVDGGGSLRRALLGDRLARRAVDQGWAGVVIHGCIRDSAEIANMPLGVKALATCPRKTEKLGRGERGLDVAFAGVIFRPGHMLYADADGIVVSDEPLV